MDNTPFTFAGFTWPRPVADMACGFAELRAKRESRKVTSGYFHSPRPNCDGLFGFYLENQGQPSPRYTMALDVSGGRRNYSPDDGFTYFCPLVLRLTHGRYLAGWTLGKHMASVVDREVFHTLRDAANRAHDMAQDACNDEADYQADLHRAEEQADAEATLAQEG